MYPKERASSGYGQPAETLREGEETAEIIAAAHGLPVVRLLPGESAREQKSMRSTSSSPDGLALIRFGV